MTHLIQHITCHCMTIVPVFQLASCFSWAYNCVCTICRWRRSWVGQRCGRLSTAALRTRGCRSHAPLHSSPAPHQSSSHSLAASAHPLTTHTHHSHITTHPLTQAAQSPLSDSDSSQLLHWKLLEIFHENMTILIYLKTAVKTTLCPIYLWNLLSSTFWGRDKVRISWREDRRI